MGDLLFLCTGNSCRSQMAEGFARRHAPPDQAVHSAGIAPTAIHPLAIHVMDEVGIDISVQHAKDLDAVPLDRIDHVVTLCGDAAERCPAFPGNPRRSHWPLEDPARARGTEADILAVFRSIRDEIAGRVQDLWKDASAPPPAL